MVGEKQEVGESRMVSDALQLSAEVGSLRGAVAALRDENAELSGESAVSSREDAESEGGGQAEAALRAEVVELRAVAAEQQALLEAGRPEAAELAEGRRALRQAEVASRPVGPHTSHSLSACRPRRSDWLRLTCPFPAPSWRFLGSAAAWWSTSTSWTQRTGGCVGRKRWPMIWRCCQRGP